MFVEAPVFYKGQGATSSKQEPEIVGRVVLSRQGTFSRERVYYRGWHPKLAPFSTLCFGLQGRETMVEWDVIRPARTFNVIESDEASK